MCSSALEGYAMRPLGFLSCAPTRFTKELEEITRLFQSGFIRVLARLIIYKLCKYYFRVVHNYLESRWQIIRNRKKNSPARLDSILVAHNLLYM